MIVPTARTGGGAAVFFGLLSAFMHLIPLPAFSDNYLWLLHDGSNALVVDPGDAGPVRAALQAQKLALRGILVTHHHADHTGGVAELQAETGASVFGPAREAIPGQVHAVRGGDQVQLLGITWQVMDVPGHTSGHIAYFAQEIDGAPLLFCGDTLFSGGCGRIFEGTPAQMLASLDALAALPPATLICCAHEYTLANLRFARTVDANNTALQRYEQQCQQLRAQGQPTLPVRLETELQINPFLRSREPAVRAAVQAYDPAARDDVAIFAALRQWKNVFS